MAITIGQPLANNAVDASFNPLPNVDSAYGPYTSVTAANTAIAAAKRSVGLTVGIKTGTAIKEYWYNNGIADSNLVEKVSASSGGGSGLNLVVAQNVEDTTTYLNAQYPSAAVPTIIVDEVLGGVYIKYKADSWVKTTGTILGSALPQVASIQGAEFVAYK